MRITRDTLLRIVRDTVNSRTRANRSIVSIYLCGSLLGDDFMLGGATDVDLVFIHTDSPAEERELVPLTADVHLDIAHHQHRDYRQPRRLRTHPWLGPTIFECEILHDPQHFMTFNQASVRGQFDRPDYTLYRSRVQAEHARQMWLEFHSEQPEPTPKVLSKYYRALEHAVNAVASLSGSPLTERRFLLRFPERAAAVHRPGLYPGLLGLLGAPNITVEMLQGWLPDWQAALAALDQVKSPARLEAPRRSYYIKGVEALLGGADPLAVLWPFERTWTQAAVYLEQTEHLGRWQAAMEQLGLLGSGFHDRIAAFDAYLDLVEETLEKWAEANGAEY